MIEGTRRALLLGAATSLLAPLPAFAAEPTLADDGYFEVWEEVGPRVAAVRQARPFHVQPIGNVTVIEQTDGLVLVDSGGSPGSGRRIVGLLKQHRPGLPVKAVILTHWHGDHPLGLSEILKAWPAARTIATEATKAHLADPKTMNTPAAADAKANAGMVARFRGFADYSREMAGKAATPADVEGWRKAARLFDRYAPDMDGALTLAPKEGFADRLAIADAAAPVEARFLGRANTDGDAVVWLPQQKVLVTGDIVVAPVPYGFGAYPREWLAVLKQVADWPFTTLIPGHGAPMRDNGYVLRLEALLETVRDQVGKAFATGMNAKQTRQAVNLDAARRSFTGGDPWLDRWFDSYWTDPIVASAWKEAKGDAIVQSLTG